MLENYQEWTGKRLELIETAGELFANSGIDGVSIREIAEKSDVNIAAINYYFGSKENLYVETLRYVAWQVRCPLAQRILQDNNINYSSKEKCIEIISKLIEERVQNYLSDKYPAWYSRLLLRSLIEPPPKYENVIFQTFIPELNALVEVLKKCNSAKTLAKCRFWAFSILGEISFYVFAEPGIKLALDIAEKYTQEFLLQLQEHITSLILKGLDLKEE
ncbi:MAG: CerR family C-terminal domain-containing protein [Candidatus Hydrogenedens sp.]